MAELIKEGKYTLLYLNQSKKWLLKVMRDKVHHTHAGFVNLNELIGKPYGVSLKSNKGVKFYALKPTTYDFIMKAKRKTQIVYPKDLGYIGIRLGIQSGMKVIEAGTGSGVLTCYLANLVKPDGHIYSYEIRKEFIEVAKQNIEAMGLSEYITIKNKDAKDGIDVKYADAGVIDVGDPWTLVKPFKESLKAGASICVICPTVNQVDKLIPKLKDEGFVDIDCLEIMLRKWEARQGMLRPATRMIAHTAYLTFARKILNKG